MQIVHQFGIRIWTVLLLLLFLHPALLARPEDYEGKRIAIIAFEPRQQPMPATELADILPLKMGEPLQLSDVRAAIETLYATGRYADIEVDATLGEGGVVVRILTEGNWFVGRVTVEGVSAPPSRGELAVASKLDLGSQFREGDGRDAIERIQQTLRSNGFYDTRIELRSEREPRTQQVNLHFVVHPGKRYHFAPPVFQGNPQRPANKLVEATHWRGWFGWKTITERRVQQGIERLRNSYQKKNHLMAKVLLEKMEPDSDTGRTIPILALDAGPVVLVETEGVKVGRDRLKRLVPVFEEQSVDQDLLVEGARNLTEYLQGQGYFEAHVSFSAEPVNGGSERRIVYKIDRGSRHKLSRIDIQGNRYFDLETIRERMLITPASIQFRRGRFSQNLLSRDVDAIKDLYRANGFRDAEVTAKVDDDYGGKKGDLAVFIQIHEGKQWLVATLTLNGVSNQDEKNLQAMLQSIPGQPFSETNVALDRENVLAYYYNGGFPNASFEWSYEPAPEPNQVDLKFVVSEGRRQFVRQVLINGYEATLPQLVHRQILLNPGEPLSQAKMLETQRKLYDLGIFSQVDVALQNPEGNEQYKYVLYQLEESRKYSASVGLGAEIARIGGSQTNLESPAGQAGFSPRVSFDISRLNFLGRAHTVSFRSRVSTLQRRALITYVAPQFRGNQNLDLSFTTLFDDSRDIRTFSARRWEASTQIGQRWTRSKTLFYRFSYRRVGVDEGTLKIRPELIPQLSQPVRVGMFSAGYVDDRRDNPADSRRGTYNQLDLGVASKFFGSQADFSRLLARNSTYHPLGSKLVLARTIVFGWLNPLRIDSSLPFAEQIPLPERFFGGGASTLRAFPQNQAGPRDPVTGFPLGGNTILIIGTELRFPLFGQNLGGVLFHDAGNVYSKVQSVSFRFHQRNEQDFDYMVHGVGFGIRYRTPVGPIRADFSFSPNSPRFIGFEGTREELLFGGGVRRLQRINQFQFHFSLGQTF